MTGHDLIDFIRPLTNLPRSCTGDGVRATLRAVGERLPVVISEIASGSGVFDWTVPDEWNFRRATLSDSEGKLLVDSDDCVLHTLIHSEPVDKVILLDELSGHLYSRDDMPDAIPYRTSYYARRWGFCMSQRQRDGLSQGEYRARIDCDLFAGHLTLGEVVVPGKTTDEFVISCHVCHPFMANDNLSGLALAVGLFRWLADRDNRLSYRLILAPGTIGAITWLAHHARHARENVKHGLIATCVGDAGPMHYKQSRSGKAVIDDVVLSTLTQMNVGHKVIEFSPYGYDERQYNSPGFDLDFGVLSRSPNGGYPEYHTSLDNFDVLKPEALAQSLAVYQRVIERVDAMEVVDRDRDIFEPRGKVYRSTNPNCEPMLGKRGLYKTTGGAVYSPTRELALLWVMNLADGLHGVDDIARQSGLALDVIEEAAAALLGVGLLE